MLFAHGGDRRGVGFTDSKENNIRAVLASRLGKSPTTINKYLQHGKGLNDAAMEELVNAGAPKLFFEAVQTQKEIGIAALQAEQKDEAAIVAEISNLVSTWWKESQQPVSAKNYNASKSAAATSKATHWPNPTHPKAKISVPHQDKEAPQEVLMTNGSPAGQRSHSHR